MSERKSRPLLLPTTPPTKKLPAAPPKELASSSRKGLKTAQLGGTGEYSVAKAEAEAAAKGEVLNADYLVAPVGPTARSRIAEWIEMRIANPELGTPEIARRIGLSPHTLNAHIAKATREGWLKFDDPLARMEYQIVPKMLDGLDGLLDRGDKSAIIETAKGTVFKMYQNAKGIQDQPQTVLALEIKMPEPGKEPTIVIGQVVGKPRENDEA